MVINITAITSSSLFYETTSSTNEIQLKYPTWETVLILLACTFIIIGTIVGNVLVCIAVAIVKKLRTPSNLLIVSLAVADLLVAVADMPLAAMYEVMNTWELGTTMCDVWTSLDVLLCTASILNLCMISIDRYLVITRPFDYAMKRTPALMALMIFSVWLLSALISIPPLFGWKAEPKDKVCELSQAIGYQFYATIGAFYLPLSIMIFIYYRIYAVSSRIHKSELMSAPQDHRPLRSTSSFASSITSNKKASNESRSGGVDRNSIESSSSRKPCLQSKNSIQSNHSRNGVDEAAHTASSPTNLAVPDHAIAIGHSEPPRKSLKNVSFLQHHPSSNSGLHKLPSASKERKTTKTLGIIMGCFVACWLPFFILALVKPLLPVGTVVPDWISALLLWLGFANSLLNPIIYARFNRDFRKPFKEIIFCRCVNINSHMRTERFTEEYGLSTDHSGSGVVRRNNRHHSRGSLPNQDRYSGTSFEGAKFF